MCSSGQPLVAGLKEYTNQASVKTFPNTELCRWRKFYPAIYVSARNVFTHTYDTYILVFIHTICIYVSMCACINTYIYIYTKVCIYAYTYIHTYISLSISVEVYLEKSVEGYTQNCYNSEEREQ